MKIKTQLTLGIGLLFVLITFMGVISATKFNLLKKHTDNILKANYNTLEYTWNMLKALEDTSRTGMELFAANLGKQQLNVTETGEQESTNKLKEYFTQYQSGKFDARYLPEIRGEIYKIMEMNMKAIRSKSDLAKQTAYTTYFWIGGTSTLCFLIAFILLINLPSGIANPIRQLTDSIKQIEAKNYKERVHLDSRSEFGELAFSFNSMAEKLEEYNHSNLARLMMEKKRVETLISKMHDPVIGLDENLRLIFANDQALKILGWQEQAVFGEYAHDLAIHNDLLRMLLDDIDEKGRKEEEKKSVPLIIIVDGKESFFEKETIHISYIPTGELKEILAGHVIILRNVTEYKELDSAKTKFIATVSHEFKTPLSSIQMSTLLLENEKTGHLNGEQKYLLISIREDVERLLRITKELLNMTQVESGKIQLSILPSKPYDILKYAIDATKMQAEMRKVGFEIFIQEDLPNVQADSEKTAWVLTNIISNAIRYSHEDSKVFLSIYRERNMVCYDVRDTGPGIAPQYKDKIFDRYFRIPGSRKEGTGLGLSISKEFIEAQGGRISVKTEMGQGSTFTICLNPTA